MRGSHWLHSEGLVDITNLITAPKTHRVLNRGPGDVNLNNLKTLAAGDSFDLHTDKLSAGLSGTTYDAGLIEWEYV